MAIDYEGSQQPSRRLCDLCKEPIPTSGGYGSGALSDGLYCSPTCFSLKDNRYYPPLRAAGDEEPDD
jgi:hypothetical protein